MWGQVLGNQYVDVESIDVYPFRNQWRGDPLNPNQALVRNNVAGYYPYPRMQKRVMAPPERVWSSMYYYPCSTIFPSYPVFADTREIILER